MGTAVASGIVAASQKAFAQEQFAQATASGSRNAFIVLLIMFLIAFVLCCLMTVNRKRGK